MKNVHELIFLKYLSLALILLFSAGTATGGAWPQGKGKGYAQISNTFLNYSGVNTGFPLQRGITEDLKRMVYDYTLQGYLEYGISKRFTFTGIIPFKMMATGNRLLEAPTDRYPKDTIAAGRLNALGNVMIGGSYSLRKEKYAWSLELDAGFPGARYNHPTGLRTGYDCWFLTPYLSLGRGYKKYYFSSSWGYRFKTNGYSDDLMAANEIGYRFEGKKRSAWLIFVLGAIIPSTAGDYDDKNSVHTGLYRNREGFVDIGFKLNYYLTENFSINTASRGVIWVRHGGDALTYSLGLAWDW